MIPADPQCAECRGTGETERMVKWTVETGARYRKFRCACRLGLKHDIIVGGKLIRTFDQKAEA